MGIARAEVIDGSDIVRKYASQALSSTARRRYRGWNDDFDQQFYDRAKFFVLANRNRKIVGLSRIIFPPLPMERAIGFERFQIDTSGACEISGVAFNSEFGLQLVLSATFDWLVKHHEGRVFALSDRSNKKFYDEIARRDARAIDTRPEDAVFFEDFTFISGAPVEWAIMEFQQPQIGRDAFLENAKGCPIDDDWKPAEDYSWLRLGRS